MLDACDRAFAAADADKTGTLNHKEFATLVKRITGEAASSKMLKKLLRLIDADMSGVVEIEEWLRFAAPLDGGHDPLDVVELEHRIEGMLQSRSRKLPPAVPVPKSTAADGRAEGRWH